MTQKKRDTLVHQVGVELGGDDPTPEKNLCSKNLRDASDGFNKRRPGCKEGHKIEVVRRVKYLATVQLLGIRGWKRRAANRDEWRRLIREANVRKEAVTP
jgi:hypothetical protein